MIALVVAQPPGRLYAHEVLVAQAQQIEETIEDTGDDVADWILRLFRGVDDDTENPKSDRRDGAGKSGGSGPRTGGSGSGDGGDDDGGGDDGGGDDGGGDDGGGDDGGGDDGGGDD